MQSIYALRHLIFLCFTLEADIQNEKKLLSIFYTKEDFAYDQRVTTSFSHDSRQSTALGWNPTLSGFIVSLPNDSTRIAAESSLLVLDIVIQLADGSIANVEVQKIGYAFPGQRSACYSADLLLRQYKRVKGEKGKLFSYKDIKKVYTIVLFEKSTSEFHQFQEIYLHLIKPQSDTGIQIELLQEYVFISLDIFRKKLI